MTWHTTFRSRFVLKDARDYVHSTTIIDDVVGFLESELPQWHPSRLDASFHDLIRDDGEFWLGDAIEHAPAGHPAAEVKLTGENRKIFVRFTPDQASPVHARIISKPDIRDFTPTGDWSGSCRIRFTDRQTLVENTVEANKQAHVRSLPDPAAWAVLNMYMRGFPIGLAPCADAHPRLEIENLGVRRVGDSYATLNRLHLPERSVRFDMSYLVRPR